QRGGFGEYGRQGYSATFPLGGGLEVNEALTTNANKPVYKLRPESNSRRAGGYGGHGGGVERYVQGGGPGCATSGCQVGWPPPTGQTGGAGGGAGGVCGDGCALDCYFQEYANYIGASTAFEALQNGAFPVPSPPSPVARGGENGGNGADGQTPTAIARPYEGD